MYARVTEFDGFGERLDEYLERVDELVLPPLREADGYSGYLSLVDREAGRVVVVSLWRTQKQMRASLPLVHQLREHAATHVGADTDWVREFEVAFSE